MSDYRRRAYVFTLTLICVAFLATLFGAGITIGERVSEAQNPLRASSVVKILVNGGHGSGVHVGGGYVLTAAHVVEGKTGLKLKTSFGDIQDVEVLWTNKARDVALLRAKRPERLQASTLICAPLVPGQKITAEGSPGQAEFVRFRGEVAGAARQAGPWKWAIPIDLSGGPGISGGPIFDERGQVAGIYVGVYLIPMGMSATFMGLGLAVPSDVICELMAKGIA
jgi:S1-C subfamily serine protease